MESLVDTIDYLGRQDVINRGSVNIGYANRFVQAKDTFTVQDNRRDNVQDAWNFYVLISGTKRTTGALLADLEETLNPLCISNGSYCIGIDGDPYARLPAFLHPLASPLTGFPDTKSIALIYEMTSTPLPADLSTMDVDQTPFGMKSYIPVIPFRGRYAREAAEIVASVSDASGLNIKLSIFGDGRALITIHYRSDHAEQIARADKAEEALWNEMNHAGFLPYRVGINEMQELVALHPEFFDTVVQLKSVLDPNNVISPRRYSPLAF